MSKSPVRFRPIVTFCLINVVLWIILSVKFFLVCGIENNFWGLAFSVTALFAHYGFIGLLLFLFLALFRLIGIKTYTLMAVLLSTVLLCLLSVDIFVFTQYRMHLNPALVGMFLSPAGKELVPIPAMMWLIAVGIVLCFAALTAGVVWLTEKRWQPWGKARTALLLFIAFCLVAYDLIYIKAHYSNYTPVLTRVEAIPYLQTMSATKVMHKLGFKQADRNQEPMASGSLHYPINELNFAKNGTQPNILIILLDSWRTDSLTPEIMPLLYKRSQTAIHFNNHFSGGNATRCGVFSIFYSIPATYWHTFLAANREPVFMDELAKRNYDFAIYATANLTQPEFDRTVFAGVKNLRLSSKGSSTVERDWDSQQEFVKFLDQRDAKKPFFGFMFYDALHGFAVPENGAKPFPTDLKTINYFILNNDTDPLPIANLYKDSAYNLDIMLNGLFADLEKRHLLENTIIMISGDHAQEVNDTHTNAWGHNSNFSEYQIKVPLLIFWPGKAPANYDYTTTHFDIVPTLMKEVFQCSSPVSDYSSGKDLFDPAVREFAVVASYNKTAIFTGTEVFVLDKYGMNHGWNLAYTKKATDLSPTVWKDALNEMSRFYLRK
jgi:uncharacterized protein